MRPEEFARHCREAAHDLRALPAEVARALDLRLTRDVAQPLADDIRAGATTLYGRRLAATTTVRTGPTPQVVLGGPQRILSGGATGRDIALAVTEGTDPGRVATIPAGTGPKGRRHRSYRQRTTRQFIGRRDPFVERTITRRLEHYADVTAGIVADVIEKVTRRA